MPSPGHRTRSEGDNFGMEPAARLAKQTLRVLPIIERRRLLCAVWTKRWEGYAISKTTRSRRGKFSTNCMTLEVRVEVGEEKTIAGKPK